MKKNIKMILPVWGLKHIENLENFSLKWMFFPGNIIEYSNSYDIELIIVTYYDSYLSIKNKTIINELSKSIDIKYSIQDGSVYKDKYEQLTDFYNKGLMQATKNTIKNNYVIFLTSDILYSSYSLKFALEKLESKYKAILITGVQVNKAEFLSEFQSSYDEKINNNMLVKIILRNLHFNSLDVCFGSENFRNNWPSHIYWNNYTNLMYAKCFHLHPFIVEIPDNVKLINGSIDVEFVNRALGYTESECYVVKDSDEIILIGLNEKSENFNTPIGRIDLYKLKKWYILNTSKFERKLFKNNFYILHATELNEDLYLKSLMLDFVGKLFEGDRLFYFKKINFIIGDIVAIIMKKIMRVYVFFRKRLSSNP